MAVCILHIGKAGGGSVRHALEPFEDGFEFRLLKHRHTLKDVASGNRAIFVVRDPLTRFVSGFNSRLRQGRPKHDNPWKNGEADAFARFSTPNELAETLSSLTASAAAEAAMQAIQHVREPLAHWLISPEYLRSREDDIAYICHQPDLAEDFEVIKHLLGLPAELALTGDPVIAHRTPAGFSTELSAYGEANIRAWYAADFLIYEECLRLRRKKRAALGHLSG